MKLNSLLYIGIISIIVGLIFTISTQSSNIRNLKKELAISTANEKALFEDNSSLQNKKRTLYHRESSSKFIYVVNLK